jgi:hypothetical protein
MRLPAVVLFICAGFENEPISSIFAVGLNQ